jgi:glycine cleavage system protein P-like pyridoxal-binding family
LRSFFALFAVRFLVASLAALFGGEKAGRIGADATHLALHCAGQAEIIVHGAQAGDWGVGVVNGGDD